MLLKICVPHKTEWRDQKGLAAQELIQAQAQCYSCLYSKYFGWQELAFPPLA